MLGGGAPRPVCLLIVAGAAAAVEVILPPAAAVGRHLPLAVLLRVSGDDVRVLRGVLPALLSSCGGGGPTPLTGNRGGPVPLTVLLWNLVAWRDGCLIEAAV